MFSIASDSESNVSSGGRECQPSPPRTIQRYTETYRCLHGLVPHIEDEVGVKTEQETDHQSTAAYPSQHRARRHQPEQRHQHSQSASNDTSTHSQSASNDTSTHSQSASNDTSTVSQPAKTPAQSASNDTSTVSQQRHQHSQSAQLTSTGIPGFYCMFS